MYFSVSLHITIYSLLNNFTHFTKGFWLLNRAVLSEQMQITIYNTFLILILASNAVSLLLLILRLHLDLRNEDSPYKLRVFTLSKSCIHCLDCWKMLDFSTALMLSRFRFLQKTDVWNSWTTVSSLIIHWRITFQMMVLLVWHPPISTFFQRN